jgi:uncharacterized protein YggE
MRIVDAVMAAVLGTGGLGVAQGIERGEAPPTLTVGGEAEVDAEPDRASVSLGATAQAATAATAQDQVNQVMSQAVAALRELGIPEGKIRTTGITLYPVYSDTRRPVQGGEQETPRIIAYRASNSVRVEVDDPAAIGGVIDAGTRAGANELSGISFDLRDDTEQRAEALRLAAANARKKADALAAGAGVRLAAVQTIVEGGVQTMPVYQRGEIRMAMEASSAPVSPGQVRVQASVTITWRIAGGATGENGEGR